MDISDKIFDDISTTSTLYDMNHPHDSNTSAFYDMNKKQNPLEKGALEEKQHTEKKTQKHDFFNIPTKTESTYWDEYDDLPANAEDRKLWFEQEYDNLLQNIIGQNCLMDEFKKTLQKELKTKHNKKLIAQLQSLLRTETEKNDGLITKALRIQRKYPDNKWEAIPYVPSRKNKLKIDDIGDGHKNQQHQQHQQLQQHQQIQQLQQLQQHQQQQQHQQHQQHQKHQQHQQHQQHPQHQQYQQRQQHQPNQPNQQRQQYQQQRQQHQHQQLIQRCQEGCSNGIQLPSNTHNTKTGTTPDSININNNKPKDILTQPNSTLSDVICEDSDLVIDQNSDTIMKNSSHNTVNNQLNLNNNDSFDHDMVQYGKEYLCRDKLSDSLEDNYLYLNKEYYNINNNTSTNNNNINNNDHKPSELPSASTLSTTEPLIGSEFDIKSNKSSLNSKTVNYDESKSNCKRVNNKSKVSLTSKKLNVINSNNINNINEQTSSLLNTQINKDKSTELLQALKKKESDLQKILDLMKQQLSNTEYPLSVCQQSQSQIIHQQKTQQQQQQQIQQQQAQQQTQQQNQQQQQQQQKHPHNQQQQYQQLDNLQEKHNQQQQQQQQLLLNEIKNSTLDTNEPIISFKILHKKISYLQIQQKEFRRLIKEQQEQMELYKKKYLKAQQRVLGQKRALENIEMNNKLIENDIKSVISKLKDNYDDKIKDFSKYPRLLKIEKTKCIQIHKDKRELEVKYAELLQEHSELKERVNQKMKKTSVSSIEKIKSLQRELKVFKNFNNSLKEERDRLKEEVRKSKDELDNFRTETNKLMFRNKDRNEAQRRSYQKKINELERDLLHCRESATCFIRQRDKVISEMQMQLGTLSDHLKLSQKHIDSLRKQIVSLSKSSPVQSDATE